MAVEQPGTDAHTKATASANTTINTPVLFAVVILVMGTLLGVVVMSIMLPDHRDTVMLLLAFVGPVVIALVALIVSANRAVTSQINELKVSVDGRLQELLKESGKAAHAQGVTDQRAGVQSPTTLEIEAAKELKAATEVIAAPAEPNGTTKTIVLEAKDMHVKASGDVNVAKDGPQPDGS